MDPGIYKNPSIDIFGLRVDEPITMLTDVLVSIVCCYAYLKLRKTEPRDRLHLLYRYFFLLMGVATFLGGLIGHSFNYALSIYWKIPGWYLSMLAIAFAERASILYSAKLIKPVYATFFTWLNIVELLFFLVISVISLNFYFVVGHSAYGLLVVIAGFQGYIYSRTRQLGSKMFLYAVAWSGLAAVIYLNQWALSKWFNHIDIGHVLMAVSSWYIYKGAIYQIQDSEYQLSG